MNGKKQKPIYIVEAARTPIGNPFKSLKTCSAVQLGAVAIQGTLKRAKINKKLVDKVILGNVVSAGTGQNIARQASLMAGLPYDVEAYTINNVCGSALQSVSLAIKAIKAGEHDCIVVGGTESATHNPFLVNREDAYINKVRGSVDSLFFDGLYCQVTKKSMGELAEDVVKKHKIFREDQDIYAFESNRKAVKAQEKGYLKKEIIPVHLSEKKKIDTDDRPRKNLKLESLWMLPPAFNKKGTITAGTSSVPCDGAVAIILASEKFVKAHKIKPKAKILAMTSVSVDPKKMFESTGQVIEKCLKQSKLSINSIDVFDIAESFAAQMVLLQNEFNIPPKKMNIYGGDIAFGHPLGASGARNLVTLINILQKKKTSRGLAAVSYGGGGSMAIVVESISKKK